MIARPKIDMLEEVLDYLGEERFSVPFSITSEGFLHSDSGKVFPPEEVSVSRIYSFEGRGENALMAVLYALATDSGQRGWVAAPSGSPESKLLLEFLERMKGVHRQ